MSKESEVTVRCEWVARKGINEGKGCDRPAYSRGLCRIHYHRQLRGQEMDQPDRVARGTGVAMQVRFSADIMDALTATADNRNLDGVGWSAYKVAQEILTKWYETEGKTEAEAWNRRHYEGKRALAKARKLK